MKRFGAIGSGPLFFAGAAGLLFLVAFAAGFLVFFPVATLKDRIETAAAAQGRPLTIAAIEEGLTGVRLRDVTLHDAADKPQLTIEEVRVRPDYSALLRGRLGLDLSARLLGGNIEGEIVRNGPFSLAAKNLLWQGPIAGFPVILHLKDAEIAGSWPPTPQSRFDGRLELDRLVLEKIPGAASPLSLGSVTASLNGSNRTLKLEKLEARGGDLTVSGGGTVTLSEPLIRSPLDLSLELHPNTSLDPSLAALLAALLPPDSSGTSRLRLTGTLSAPKQQNSRAE